MGFGLDEVVALELRGGVVAPPEGPPDVGLNEYLPLYGSSGHLAMLTRASDGHPVEGYEYSPYGERSIFVNDEIAPEVEQVRRRGEALWVEVSEEVRLESVVEGITLENVTLGEALPVLLAQPVLRCQALLNAASRIRPNRARYRPR